MSVSRNAALNEIIRLAAILQTQKREGQEPFALYIGARASLTQEGRTFAEELRRRVLMADWGAHLSEAEFAALSEEEIEEKFARTWGQLPRNIQFQQVREICSALPLSDGYQALARLIREGYFRLILTSNVDRLIEDALIREDVERRQWSTLVNGRDTPEVIRNVLMAPGVATVIVQLCGDAYSCQEFITGLPERPGINALVTLKDIEHHTRPLMEMLAGHLSCPLIVVGYDLLDDRIIQHFPERRNEVVYYAGTSRPPGGWHFYQRFPRERRVDIVDEALNFDGFFTTLAKRLGLFQDLESIGTPVTREAVEQALETAGASAPEEVLVEIISTERKRFRPVEAGEGLVSLVRTTVFTIRVDAGCHISFNVMGDRNYTDQEAKEWRVNVEDLNVMVQDMGQAIAAYHRLGDAERRDSWRRQAKREGKRLYEDLMAAYPDLGRKLELARQIVDPPECLTLAFSGPRQHLGMPYELLHDGQVPLAVRHPLCRQVSGVTVRHSQDLDTFLRTLRRGNQALRILLIASDTGGGLTADEEVRALEGIIRQKAHQARLSVQVDCLLTGQAGLGEVKERLRECPYHLVHYAGHGYFSEHTGEDSGLLFWREKGRRGGTALLTARELAQLLVGGQTRLFYLSCCVGATVGGESLLRDNDYLGVMDAIVQAGVPYVLGYRWYVTDSGSRRFATFFYEHLFTSPYVPERAAWYARSQIYGADGQDETWTSPILVAQNLYLG